VRSSSIWQPETLPEFRSAAVCYLLFACSLYGQAGLTLAEAIAEANASHPQNLAARDRVSSAEGLRRQAGLTYNPRLFLQAENYRFWSSPSLDYRTDTDNFGYLTQVFESGGKRERRVEVASSVVRMTEWQRAAQERQIAGRVSLAYWTAAAAANLKDLLQRDVETYDEIVQYHRNRVREGAMAEVDLLRVQLERDRVQVTARNAEAEYAQAIIALQREMGRTNFTQPALTDKLSSVRDLEHPAIAAVLSARPEVEAARADVDRARANVRLQQAGAKPDPELLFGYKRTAGFNTLIGGFQINLPVRNRNEGQIASASAEVRLAENLARATESQIRAEVESAWTAYDTRRRLLNETLGPMQDRANEIARIALAAYQEGGVDLLRLIDAQRARLDAMTTYYRALSEYQQSVTTLQIVTGAPL
jgi:cobalt-zinc-cadmium efflux system outer membrane protein